MPVALDRLDHEGDGLARLHRELGAKAQGGVVEQLGVAADAQVQIHAAEIAADGIITFSLVSVVLPCALGILLRHLAGTARVLALMPSIKVVNLVVLLTLSYTNASGALVQVVARPDYDLLAAVFAITGAMCLLAFTVGAGIAARLRCRPAETTSLVFGVGMNNSSASAVLAGTQMADHPLVLLPILAYSMTQKVLAGLVDARLRRQRDAAGN